MNLEPWTVQGFTLVINTFSKKEGKDKEKIDHTDTTQKVIVFKKQED